MINAQSLFAQDRQANGVLCLSGRSHEFQYLDPDISFIHETGMDDVEHDKDGAVGFTRVGVVAEFVRLEFLRSPWDLISGR